MKQEILLNRRQLFSLTRKTLEKRIRKNYYQTGNEQDTIEFLIALQVREELGEEDFSFVLEDLIRQIFLQSKPTRILRRYYVFFKEYFVQKEWRILSIRLFPIKTFIAEKAKQLYTQFIKTPLKGLVGS
ncbi:hypothetical protein [Enterococcus malodoratus]|uniref:Uncharacterized protein n=1 Tax=Enterococcus malodoratus ATCC 43197 TaxID=1158601 RepID=R2PEM9_9ENTE|nr:hypothetical protein [Enterococcus malodoratus]EOH81688.1 hypothetical protein UAI_00296 [Enterococcus malodoratus ATCC 43197]EOT68770.1 hypothetical protein I585_00228 [Enterococcus malodoratus ATCC 43197]OJG64840.1 hypothetical protein RV07_GL003793 [Enterococcus malodoratus]SPW86537.1 Uncharacterised protein [Enterococcus malodoratus]STC71873.1 Uncharacterised protein [Enterococcus malodoratus]